MVSLSLKLTKMHQTPLVSLHAEGDWSADIDSIVLYNPLQPFQSSTWDWIGLYKVIRPPAAHQGFCFYLTHSMSEFQVGFSSVSDYITYTWVKDDEVAFNDKVMQVAAKGAWSVAESEYKCLQRRFTLLLFLGVHE